MIKEHIYLQYDFTTCTMYILVSVAVFISIYKS